MDTVALLTHRTASRARLRVPARRRNATWFEQARRTLLECGAVRSVAVNPLSASILVTHAADFDQVVEFAAARGLFAVQAPSMPAIPASEHFAGKLRKVDTRLQELSRGAVDARAVAFAGLLLAGVWQLLRGNILPAAGSLVWYAFSSLPAAPARRAGREGPSASE
jgi:hypothetical protein